MKNEKFKKKKWVPCTTVASGAKTPTQTPKTNEPTFTCPFSLHGSHCQSVITPQTSTVHFTSRSSFSAIWIQSFGQYSPKPRRVASLAYLFSPPLIVTPPFTPPSLHLSRSIDGSPTSHSRVRNARPHDRRRRRAIPRRFPISRHRFPSIQTHHPFPHFLSSF